MTSPNYYGFCADIPAIAALCHEKNVALLVDAAHGAHFGFSPLLPIQPVDADGWVVSAHKTLCVSNQGSRMCIRDRFNSIEKGSLYPMALFQIQNLRSNEVHRKVSVNVLLPVDSHAQHPAGAVSYTHLDVYKRQGEYDRKIETQRN